MVPIFELFQNLIYINSYLLLEKQVKRVTPYDSLKDGHFFRILALLIEYILLQGHPT